MLSCGCNDDARERLQLGPAVAAGMTYGCWRSTALWILNLIQPSSGSCGVVYPRDIKTSGMQTDGSAAKRPLIRCLLQSVAWIHPHVLFIKLYYRFISQKRVFKVRQVWPLSKKWTMVKISKVQPFNLQNLLEVIMKRKCDGQKAGAKMYD